MEEQDGTLVLASLQIAPTGSDFKGMELASTRVPRGGITSEVVRAFKIEERLLNVARLAAISRTPLLRFSSTVRVSKPKRGRPGLGDLYYAQIAVEYEERGLAGSRRPVADMAEAHHQSPERMTAIVSAARRYGFLTKAEQGKPGGRATAKARRLIEQASRGEPRGKGKR